MMAPINWIKLNVSPRIKKASRIVVIGPRAAMIPKLFAPISFIDALTKNEGKTVQNTAMIRP